jgi:ERCC4-type nuclease
VFATYRDTVQQITDRLLSAGISSERFVGQATKDSEKGLSQKRQLEALGRFRAGTSRVLVATSVGEEGLDIPATDLVVFYEAVPSEIRSIQRKGRTGRSGAGKIVILVTKGTSDEVYRFVSQFRERSMRAGIRQMSAFSPGAASITGDFGTTGPTEQSGRTAGTGPEDETDRQRAEAVTGPGAVTGLILPVTDRAVTNPGERPGATWSGQARAEPRGQSRIDSFVPAEIPGDTPGPVIVVDDRETGSRVVEELHRMGISIRLKRLTQGDYAIGDRVLVERKTVRDFVDTLVERDLLAQLRELADAVPRPVIVIEGDKDLYAQRDVHPNAIRGTLAAIAVDLGIAVFRSSGPEDTAGILAVLARRESGGSREPRLPIRKPGPSPRARAEQVIATFPEIGLRQARVLLDHFGSVKGVVDADEAALLQVPGIGEKRAKQIAALSRHPYREDRRKEQPDS